MYIKKVAAHCLLEGLEVRVRPNCLQKVVPEMGEVRNKRVRCAVSVDFGGLIRRGLLEEHVHPGDGWEDWRIERVEGAMLENRLETTERPLTCLRCESNRPCASASL